MLRRSTVRSCGRYSSVVSGRSRASHFALVVPRGCSTHASAHLRAASNASEAGGADFGVNGDAVSLVSVTLGVVVVVVCSTVPAVFLGACWPALPGSTAGSRQPADAI